MTIRKLIRASSRKNTPQQAAELVRFRECAEQAFRETMARFAPLTVSNFHDAAAWQERRIQELQKVSAIV